MSGLVDLRAPLEQEGTKSVVRAWLKGVGEAVALDEPVLELETDKVAVEVAAPIAGVLAEQCLAVDDEAGAGALLGRISTVAGVERHPGQPARRSGTQESEAPELLPPLGPGSAALSRLGRDDEGGAQVEQRLSP